MSNKVKVSWQEIDDACNKLAINLLKDGFKPDYIVGITRGGLTPAVILSQILEVPMYTLKVTLRDGVEEDCDHNCWMPEDALGYDKDPVNSSSLMISTIVVLLSLGLRRIGQVLVCQMMNAGIPVGITM